MVVKWIWQERNSKTKLTKNIEYELKGCEMERALVLFSGGQDSATCLIWALSNFDHVETIGFEYNQIHKVELTIRKTFLEKIKESYPKWSDKIGTDHLLPLPFLSTITDSSLTQSQKIEIDESGLPNSFVPGRNLLFFMVAATLGYKINTRHLIGGMCETDFSGYPDCRDNTIKALQVSINLGMDSKFIIHTPLMWLNKAQTWEMAENLGGKDLVNLIVEFTHTCYRGDRESLNSWGYGCGTCPACELRASGYNKFISSHK